MFRLTKITVQNFGPFVDKHSVELPENGLSLIRGKVLETGDGSGAGKSYLLNAVSYVLGFCPFPATELQSWYTDEPPLASIELLTDKGPVTLTRKKGLTLKCDFLTEKEYKGKAAEAQLDLLFGMDKELRKQTIYRPQGEPGLFLEMDDSEKKSFLSKVLDLGKYEGIADRASKAVSALEQELKFKESTLNLHRDNYVKANERLSNHCYPDNIERLKDKKSSIINKLDELKLKKSDITCKIDKVRKSNNNELEAVLSTIRAKLTLINNRGESVEVTALKAELQKQQQRLEKCRQYDVQQKIEVQKARDNIKVSTKQLEIEHQKIVSGTISTFDKGIGDIKAGIAKLSGSEAKVKELELVLCKLNEQKCPTCGQMWEKALQQIHNTKSLIESAKSDVTLLNEGKAKLVELQQLKEKYIKDEKENLEGALKVHQTELDNIKDPEPHPAGEQVKNKILEITNNIKELENNNKLQKQKNLELVFAEEKEAKDAFRVKLDNEIEELEIEFNEVETEIAVKFSELSSVNNEIAYVEKETAIHGELRKSFEDTWKAYKEAEREFEGVKGKLAMESDIVALVGRQGFLGAIFSDVLDEIASHTNDILSKVANVRHLTIDFETEKESCTGNVTSRITPVIYNKGRKISYKGGISGGMRTSIQLAVDLAVGNVISSRKNQYPSFLILDEALDGLGSLSKEAAIMMLEGVSVNKLVLVVDHSIELAPMFNQIIDVEMSDGQSRIV